MSKLEHPKRLVPILWLHFGDGIFGAFIFIKTLLFPTYYINAPLRVTRICSIISFPIILFLTLTRFFPPLVLCLVFSGYGLWLAVISGANRRETNLLCWLYFWEELSFLVSEMTKLPRPECTTICRQDWWTFDSHLASVRLS